MVSCMQLTVLEVLCGAIKPVEVKKHVVSNFCSCESHHHHNCGCDCMGRSCYKEDDSNAEDRHIVLYCVKSNSLHHFSYYLFPQMSSIHISCNFEFFRPNLVYLSNCILAIIITLMFDRII